MGQKQRSTVPSCPSVESCLSGEAALALDGSDLECAAEPTLAAVALLHLERMAAIRAVEDHPIERVNGS